MTQVLVVDDEPEIRALLKLILERDGYEVLEAGNGVDALALCQEQTIDLILTDLLMPKMSGTDLLQELADMGAESKIIAMTGGSLGSDAHTDMAKAQKLGIDGVIVKPFDPAEVTSVCKRIIESA